MKKSTIKAKIMQGWFKSTPKKLKTGTYGKTMKVKKIKEHSFKVHRANNSKTRSTRKFRRRWKLRNASSLNRFKVGDKVLLVLGYNKDVELVKPYKGMKKDLNFIFIQGAKYKPNQVDLAYSHINNDHLSLKALEFIFTRKSFNPKRLVKFSKSLKSKGYKLNLLNRGFARSIELNTLSAKVYIDLFIKEAVNTSDMWMFIKAHRESLYFIQDTDKAISALNYLKLKINSLEIKDPTVRVKFTAEIDSWSKERIRKDKELEDLL